MIEKKWLFYLGEGKMKKMGFTIIELMIVVAIIAFLAMVSVPTFSRFLAKAKRAEAYMNLSSIYAAEKAYWAENGTFCDILYGEHGVGWKPEGYQGGGSRENFYYTYGFGNGSEGHNFFTGKLNTANTHLSRSVAGKDKFIALAAGDILGNGHPDILMVDENNRITIIQDALAS
jgi:prepilin-type N-terminal cleavage/methylation domain-containing protein